LTSWVVVLAGHGLDDGFDLSHLAIIDAVLGLLELLGHTRQERQDAPERPEFLHLLELGEKVLQREPAFEETGGPLLGHVTVELTLGLFDEAQHVAHAQDATGHPVGMELVEVGQPLTGGGEGDGSTDHFLHAQSGATAGVAVQLGEDDPVEIEGLVEGLGGGHGVLAGHGVDDQEGVVGIHRLGDLPDLFHEIGVDGQAAGSVHDEHITAEAPGLVQTGGGHGHRIGRFAEHGHAGLGAENS
jgi:hypothetical protein